jgi:hypothetical protein
VLNACRGALGSDSAVLTRRRCPNNQFTRMLKLSGDVFTALGLPFLQAPGEGEALCAQLVACGGATAAWTTDGDALLYGAGRLYRTLALSRANLKACETDRIDLEDVKACFGLSSGDCHEVLVAFALLAGCDYAVDGASGVGAVGVARALKHMLSTLPGDGTGLLEHIKQRLSDPDTDEASHTALKAVACTGCLHCGHDSGGASKVAHSSKHKRSGCAGCGTPFGCLPKPEGMSCACPFHAGSDARHVAKVLDRARKTPGFLQRFDARVAAFKSELASARTAALLAVGSAADGRSSSSSGRTPLRWASRPDVDRLSAVMGPGGTCGWSRDTLFRKILPLLLLWDATHRDCRAACFKVAKVLKPSGEGAKFGLQPASAFAVQWAARPDLSAAQAEDAALGLRLLAKPQKETAGGTDGGSENGTLAAADVRVMWTHVLDEHCRPLLAACQAEVAAKEAHKAKAAARKAELDARRAQEALTQPKISALLATIQPRSAASPGGAPRPQGKALGPYDDAMPPALPSWSGDNSEGYRTAFGLPRDDDEVDGAAYDSDVEGEEALPSGWADRPSAVKRGSPVKPSQNGTPPKKAKPSPARAAAAATPVPATVQRSIRGFLGRQQEDPTPATVEAPPQGAGPARARSGAARQLGFAAAPGPGPITEEEVIDLTASPQDTQKAAAAAGHDIIDLSASPDA